MTEDCPLYRCSALRSPGRAEQVEARGSRLGFVCPVVIDHRPVLWVPSMDLHTVNRVRRPARAEEIASWEAGFAWLAGGTWLFSEPQVDVHTLIDLESLDWPALQASEDGLEIASTCKVVELDQFVDRAPPDWTAAPLFRQCCRSFLASFKIWNEATVGGNICMSLPAGPMISLTAALEGVCTLWPRSGEPRRVVRCRFRDRQPPECPRTRRIDAIDIPARCTHSARSSPSGGSRSRTSGDRKCCLIGTRCPAHGEFLLTITAATRPPGSAPL